jgi:hypothetical protein
MKKWTVIYTQSIGSYDGALVRMCRVTQRPKETLDDAINRSGYGALIKAGEEPYDISDSVVFVFEGWPELTGDFHS